MSATPLSALLAAITCSAITSSAIASSATVFSAIDVLPVVPGIQMLTVEGVNVVVQTGPEGTLVVNTGPPSAAEALLARIRQVTGTPIRYVIATNSDKALVGGAATVASFGQALNQTPEQSSLLSGGVKDEQVGAVARIVATESLADPDIVLPTETFSWPVYNFFLNDQPVLVTALPAGRSQGDSAVSFERQGVVVAGAVFDATRFPVIDLAHGGSIQGVVDALNQLLNTRVFAPTPRQSREGGTLVIPVRGPISDQADLLAYRDMVGIMRDRVSALIEQGKNLSQVLAARPALGYESLYGADDGPWTTRDFIEAVYKSLLAEKQIRRKK
jgi:glyoxylase-like metal-dependent hydrolase (beta-lactamase superfamily II)